MRRVFFGLMALGAVAIVLGSGSSAEAGLFSGLFGGSSNGCCKVKKASCKTVKTTCCKPVRVTCCKPKVTCCKPKPTCCGSAGHGGTPKVEDAPAPPPGKAPAPPKPKKGKKA